MRKAPAVKGIHFDTNKTYSKSATFYMLTSGKISAYGDASRFINYFCLGDYAFYCVKGEGIFATDEIILESSKATDFEGDKGMYNHLPCF